jgi:hypothetical protein
MPMVAGRLFVAVDRLPVHPAGWRWMVASPRLTGTILATPIHLVRHASVASSGPVRTAETKLTKVNFRVDRAAVVSNPLPPNRQNRYDGGV